MDVELQPTTEPGRAFVALAEQHATDFATRAAEHDREGSFPFENIAALQKSGFMAAPVPEEFGGMGLTSLYDTMVGVSRLARGDASTAIASNMHLASAAVMRRIWKHRNAETPANVTGAIEGFMRAIGAGQLIGCGPATEAGTDLSSPMTELTPTEGGFLLNGHKIFGTLSPVAHVMFSTARLKREDGSYDRALAVVPRGSSGMEIKDNWDALGMRASGSGDVVYTDCFVPQAMALIEGGWGNLDADMALAPNAPLIACSLGIAEAARDIAVRGVTSLRKGARGKLLAERIPIQQLVAEIEVDLATMRALIERFGRLADEYLDRYGPNDDPQEARVILKEQQCMKWVVNRKGIDVVDRALTLSGGAGYMSKHPLSRLYRDVRAGPFMQPFAPYEALEYIGKVTLGIDPPVDR